jgi:hypothetical protein
MSRIDRFYQYFIQPFGWPIAVFIALVILGVLCWAIGI